MPLKASESEGFHEIAERMHLWMHLNAPSDERSVAFELAGTIAETLGDKALGRLVSALEGKIEATD